MSSSHSPRDLLLLLPLQESSSCNCQYQLKKNNYYNKTYNCNVVYNNYNKFKNNKSPEYILFSILVVPLLISTTSTTFVKIKQISSLTSEDPAKQVQTSIRKFISADSSTTKRNTDVQYTKSLKLLLRILTGFLIIQGFFKYLRALHIHNGIKLTLLEVFNRLQEVGVIFDYTSIIRCYHLFISHTNLTTYIPTTKKHKQYCSAAQIVLKPEEAFKFNFSFSKHIPKSLENIEKRLLSIHTAKSLEDFLKKIILPIIFKT